MEKKQTAPKEERLNVVCRYNGAGERAEAIIRQAFAAFVRAELARGDETGVK
jgi:hypothetical protein